MPAASIKHCYDTDTSTCAGAEGIPKHSPRLHAALRRQPLFLPHTPCVIPLRSPLYCPPPSPSSPPHTHTHPHPHTLTHLMPCPVGSGATSRGPCGCLCPAGKCVRQGYVQACSPPLHGSGHTYMHIPEVIYHTGIDTDDPHPHLSYGADMGLRLVNCHREAKVSHLGHHAAVGLPDITSQQHVARLEWRGGGREA